jgi:protein-ribulosamine 3-kinase
LQLIGAQSAIRVPKVLKIEEVGDQQFLLLEWIESGERTPLFWERFGESLAHLHRVTNPSFGLDHANFMGSVPQQNRWSPQWVSFFLNYRLQPLILQCRQQNLLSNKHEKDFEKLALLLPQIFNDDERPSLLHGDLWSGNFMCDQFSQPFLIDPAIYFGHRSVDLAMTTLFGGFAKEFYEAYHFHYPFPHNYKEQWPVCNLYPLLIHLLLFGKSYLPQIENTLAAFA